MDPEDNPQEPVAKLSKMSSTKAKKKEGYLMTGNLYQNRITNVLKHFREAKDTKDLFRFNEFLGDIEYNASPPWNKNIKAGKRIEDNDEIYIKGWFADKYYYEPTRNVIGEALFLHATANKVHPIKQYLEGLKWDKKKRLDSWFVKVSGVDNDIYNQLIGRKLICAMVRRIYQPGCQYDNLVVMEGKQGIYKTTMLRILGGDFYAPFSIKAESKDAVDVMSGKWLLEMEELTTLRYGDIEHIKAFLSRTTDRVRLSYGRYARDFPRQCVFVGTMNPIGDNQYFKDPSENRRFWPVECKGKINIEWLKENRDQLFAEAMTVYQKEALYMDNPEALKISIKKQEDRRPEDSWSDLILEFLTEKKVVTGTEILRGALHFAADKISMRDSTRIGICMKSLGWEKRQFGKEKKKYYVRPGTSEQDISMSIGELWDE